MIPQELEANLRARLERQQLDLTAEVVAAVGSDEVDVVLLNEAPVALPTACSATGS